MKTISLCMIAKNEEAVLSRVLDCASEFADEIIVVDTGSHDRTVEIAREYTDKVFSLPWQDDFSAARNFAFSKAVMDYQMWLDADDILPKDSIKKLLAWKASSTAPDMVMMPYHTAFDADGAPLISCYRERLMRTSHGFKWRGAVHEAIAPSGVIEHLDAPVIHRKEGTGDPDRNLRIFEKQLSRGESLTPRERYYYARELYYHGCPSQAAEHFSTVAGDSAAWLENRIDACRMLYRCLTALNRPRRAIEALLKAFSLAPPRAEVCCDIGEHFISLRDYTTAIFWYRLATTLPRRDELGGFVTPDCYDFTPYLQLCVCYDRLGDIPNARLYHQKAAACKPHHPAVVHNEKYFSSL